MGARQGSHRKGGSTHLSLLLSATIPMYPAWLTTTTLPDGEVIDDENTILVPGKLELFSNVKDGRWRGRPNTILVDSEQLESGET